MEGLGAKAKPPHTNKKPKGMSRKAPEEDEGAYKTPSLFRNGRARVLELLRRGPSDTQALEAVRKAVQAGSHDGKALCHSTYNAYVRLMHRETIPYFPLTALKIALLLEEELSMPPQFQCRNGNLLQIIEDCQAMRLVYCPGKPGSKPGSKPYRSWNANLLLQAYLRDAAHAPLPEQEASELAAVQASEKVRWGVDMTLAVMRLREEELREWLQAQQTSNTLKLACADRFAQLQGSWGVTSASRALAQQYLDWAKAQRIAAWPMTMLKAALALYDLAQTESSAVKLNALRDTFFTMLQLCPDDTPVDVGQPRCPALWAEIAPVVTTAPKRKNAASSDEADASAILLGMSTGNSEGQAKRARSSAPSPSLPHSRLSSYATDSPLTYPAATPASSVATPFSLSRSSLLAPSPAQASEASFTFSPPSLAWPYGAGTTPMLNATETAQSSEPTARPLTASSAGWLDQIIGQYQEATGDHQGDHLEMLADLAFLEESLIEPRTGPAGMEDLIWSQESLAASGQALVQPPWSEDILAGPTDFDDLGTLFGI